MMQNSVLEITNNEYLIKLDKNEFDLGFIKSILKRIQNQQTYFTRNDEDGDIISRRSEQEDLSFDHLSEK